MKNTLRIFSLTLVAFTSLYASESSQGNIITKKEVKLLTAAASTQADNRKLAVYYEQKVLRETAEWGGPTRYLSSNMVSHNRSC